jgi:hypothetical protein
MELRAVQPIDSSVVDKMEVLMEVGNWGGVQFILLFLQNLRIFFLCDFLDYETSFQVKFREGAGD